METTTSGKDGTMTQVTPKHYLVVTLADGKDAVKREYVALTTPDENPDDAFGRWLASHPDLKNRQRNRAKAEASIRASVLSTKLARPSSWYRENKLGAFAESNGNGTATTKRKK